MNYTTHSYRFAKEIIEHPNYTSAFQEIITVVNECPLFIYPNKSSSNNRLDVVQQLLNTFFDRRFACDFGWDYHPSATSIPNSGLAADYRKNFNGLRIQAEVQFGNMSRWYSDIFKFQTAYSQDLIDMGLCIVPISTIATRIDSNVTNFERCVRELPSAKLSITLPILLIGMSIDSTTSIVDVSKSGFSNIRLVTGKSNAANKYKIVNGFLTHTPIEQININSEIGPVASLADSEEEV
jgi:hypothetical protein